MTFINDQGRKVYINPSRIDSMVEVDVVEGTDMVTGTRIHVYSTTYTTASKFDDLVSQIQRDKGNAKA